MNDTVLYGTEGVCKIKDIVRENFGGGTMEYYVLQPIYKDSLTIFVHTGNDHLISKMRRVLSRQEIDEIIRTMPEETLLNIENESTREIKYQEIINSGDRRAVVKLIKTIYLRQKSRKEQKKKPYATDERFLKEAEKLLYDEFALVLNVKPNQVLPFIIKQIEQSKKEKSPCMQPAII
ncbi:CarD family transcriptional regulator [Eubacterium sp. 1001713B170207_170306_E7]|uniref:CarD family transcriptional regulator n=1 Tax=Eubacterium sp. 1001713B170207_170306_E7 TaxID=2787097 RepID=UPI00189BA4DF|nr:CarD family transcriptional regulator [Eubacterium sp. 1001713B170207_170306_E7]